MVNIPNIGNCAHLYLTVLLQSHYQSIYARNPRNIKQNYRMKNLIFTIFMLMFGISNTFSSNEIEQVSKNRTDANLYGHIVDKNSGDHLPYATIALKGKAIGTTADATGHFYLKNLPEGRATIVVTLMGYSSQEQVVDLKGESTIELNFQLEEDNVAIDQVVVSASRTAHTRRESPSLVSVLSSDMFDKVGAVSLADGLDYQPGVRVEDNCQNCGFTQVRINGLDGQYSQILMDSRPVFSALTGVYGLEQIPASMIDRVEVVRGGGSALFGSSAIGGTINIITKEPTINSGEIAHQLTSIGISGALDNNTTANASIVTDNNKTGLIIYGQNRSRDSYDHDGDKFSEVPKIQSQTLGLRSFFRTSDYSKLTLQYHATKEYRRGGDQLDLPAHKSKIAEELNHNINGGGITFDYFAPGYRDHLSLFASFQHTDRRSFYGTDQTPDAYGTTEDLVFVTGTQYSRKWDKLWFMPAEFVSGFEYNYNDLVDESLDATTNIAQETHTLSLFAQNEWRTDKFGILIGARLDKHNLIDKVVLSPRANFRYNPTKNINLRATFSTGFRAPQAFNEDLHIAIVGGERMITVISPDLKQETSQSVSLSADFYKNIGRFQTNFLVEGFYTNLDDIFALREIDSSEDSEGITTKIMERYNASGATVRGFNLEAKAMYSTRLQLQAGLTLQKSEYYDAEAWSDDENVAPEKRMFRTPDVYGYFTASYSPVMPLTLSATATYSGEMLVQHMAGSGTPVDVAVQTPSFFDMNLKIAYNFIVFGYSKLEISGGVKNVFNQFQNDFDKYENRDAGYVYGPSLPRSLFFGAKISF